MSIQSIIWLALLVGFLLLELATMGLATIWFAGGALVAFLLSLFTGSWPLQIVVFAAVSVILLALTRPIAMRYVNRNRISTNAESLIGKTAVVTEDIDNLASRGQAMINGQEWSARSTSDEERIAKGSKVTVTEIRGVKLIVTREL